MPASHASGTTHLTQVSTWGVFPRPSNISAAYGGGRTIKPGVRAHPAPLVVARHQPRVCIMFGACRLPWRPCTPNSASCCSLQQHCRAQAARLCTRPTHFAGEQIEDPQQSAARAAEYAASLARYKKKVLAHGHALPHRGVGLCLVSLCAPNENELALLQGSPGAHAVKVGLAQGTCTEIQSKTSTPAVLFTQMGLEVDEGLEAEADGIVKRGMRGAHVHMGCTGGARQLVQGAWSSAA